MRFIASIDEAVGAAGQELGVSRWIEIDQDRINAFADATGDHQWIHVNAERARSESPYGTTIVHGFLTLSLIPGLSKGQLSRGQREDGDQLRTQQGTVSCASSGGQSSTTSIRPR